MTNISKEIFDNFQIRKTKKQKQSFIELLKNRYPHLKVQSGGFPKNNNIIIGDVEKAKMLLSAHYDTCVKLPIPNFVTPKNWWCLVLYNLFVGFWFFAVATLINVAFRLIFKGFEYIDLLCLVATYAFLINLFMGKANKHTANDNTSGVITLLEIYENMTAEEREKTAFVFFDNEEKGLFGSRYFKKKYNNILQNKLLINFDCVSDGENIMLVQSKKAREMFQDKLKNAFVENDGKNPMFEVSSNTFYPSDQMGFPYGIGVASLKYRKIIGYYMNRIHTKKDVIFDQSNIEYLKKATIQFINTL